MKPKDRFLMVFLEGPVRPEESLDAIKNGYTVDSLAQAMYKSRLRPDRGGCDGCDSPTSRTNPLMVG